MSPPDVGDEITAMGGDGVPRRARVTQVEISHRWARGGRIFFNYITHIPVADLNKGDPVAQAMASAADVIEEGVIWARGWGDDVEAVLRATYVLQEPQ